MWNSIANFRENLSQMASEVLETMDELEGTTPRAEDGEVATGSESPGYGSQTNKLRKPFDLGRPRRVREEMNGVVSSEVEECRRRCQELEEREQELRNQMRSKEEAYRSLDGSYRDALHEVEKLKVELAELNAKLQERETSTSELENQQKLQEEAPHFSEEQFLKEVQRRDETIYQMRQSLLSMEKELTELKAERDQLKAVPERDEVSSKPQANSDDNVHMEMLKTQAQQLEIVSEKLKSTENAFKAEKNDLTMKLEAVTREKDRAISNLNRLKQHLLEKESEDSEKMDRDSEQIALLEAKSAASNARVLQLEQALSQTLASQAESTRRFNDELDTLKLQIESHVSKAKNLYAAVEAKDMEIANLQVALGQYYAESEAKERLQRQLESTNNELRRLSGELEAAKETISANELQAKEAAEKIHLTEKKLLDSQLGGQKMQTDLVKLRRALEESMIRLNRMSTDSDFSVDRRIVIKLLVTYFERGHNREVLDLMTRMLGFTEDDKRRVGLAHQNAGKGGVVRSVFGLPGRMVGGLLGGGAPEAPGLATSSATQSFADLWIDFLLKESEERDKKERAEPESERDVGDSTFAVHAKPENGFAHDDVLSADFSLRTSASTSSLDVPIKGGHRRNFSRS